MNGKHRKLNIPFLKFIILSYNSFRFFDYLPDISINFQRQK